MEITKKLESEILRVIEDYWSSYLHGDLQTWASYLPDDYRNIGMTKAEIWNSKKEIVDYTEKILDQVIGMAETRNKKVQIIPYGTYFMVHELDDLYVKAEEGWVFYTPFRLSSLLEKTTDGWKVLHQHGSYPDSKTEEGETFAFDELRAENKKLRDAIQACTIELERKNRELEIEAALERVRARTMAMHSSEELLETGALLFRELSTLDVKIFNCSYVLMDDKAKMGWNYGVNPGDGTIRPLPTGVPQSGTKVLDAITESWKKQEPFLLIELDPQQTIGHQTYVAENMPNFSLTKEQLLALSPERLAIHTFNFKHGYLLLVGGKPLTTDQQQMVMRFANEFERTYTRFLDLQKAEEQARKIILVNQENERLLHSILPMPIAEQIRTGSQSIVQRFEQVSILFADIVGFTVLSEKLSPGDVVDILNGLFSKFDDLTDQHNLEKIKTIGDAYMVAAGVPEEKADHAMTMFHFAQDMLRSLGEYNQSHNSQLNLRIGISSGPVVAGVIGKKKFAYDLWGDTVNTAARMEAYGQAGRIQVSPTTYGILKTAFDFEKIPKVEIKGKGVMDVYLWKA